MVRTITTIRGKFNKFGYADEVDFIQDNHDQGGKTYEMMRKERWEDGHFTYPTKHHLSFNNREEGNREYKKLITEGYEFVCKFSFEPTKMDMR